MSVAVLTEQETRDAFAVWMHRKKIQPVWLRIDNRSDRDFVFLMTHLDPDYFSSHETAWQSHFFLGFGRNAKMDDHMYKEKIRPFVPAGSSVEGFVYTNRDVGMKVVSVKLLTEGDLLILNKHHEVAIGQQVTGRRASVGADLDSSHTTDH